MTSRGITIEVVASLLALAATPGCDRSPVAPSSPSQPAGPTPLAVSQVLPNSGPSESAVSVAVFGTGFQSGARVTIGGVPTEATVSSPTSISTTAPPHDPGPVDVVVINPDGQRASLTGAYTYLVPTVTSVSPAAGLGGDAIQIAGVGLAAGASVTIGGLSALVISARETIWALAPSHAPGPVDVVVTSPSGQSATLSGGFTYQSVAMTAAPALVSAGQEVTVSWVSPPGRSPWDWIAVVKVTAPDGTCAEGWWRHTKGVSSGALTFAAPAEPGQYELRYLVGEACVDAARSNTITVASGASTLGSPSVGRAGSRGR